MLSSCSAYFNLSPNQSNKSGIRRRVVHDELESGCCQHFRTIHKREKMQITSALVVCRSLPAIEPLPHVYACIASFLAPPPKWTIADAIQRGCPRLAACKIKALAFDPALSSLDKCARGRKAVLVAARMGEFKLMLYLWLFLGSPLDELAAHEAVRGGQLDTLCLAYRLLRQTSADHISGQRLFSDDVVRDAIKAGNVVMLQWMYVACGCDMSGMSLALEAECGHLDIVKWLCEATEATLQPWEVVGISDAGHEHVFRYLHSKRPLQFSSEAMDSAAHCGRLDLVRWMDDNGGEGCTEFAINIVAGKGDLDIVRWLHLNAKPSSAKCSTQAMNAAARSGHLEIVKFLHENRTEGCTKAAVDGVAGNNHLDVVAYLAEHRQEGCSRAAMDRASKKGHIGMVKLLEQHFNHFGCTTAAMDGAARYGHLEAAQWLHANRSEGCTTEAINRAAKNGHLHVVQWLHANRSEGCTIKAMDGAARLGRMDILQCLHSNRTKNCSTRAVDHAARDDHSEIMEWTREHRPEGATFWVPYHLLGDLSHYSAKWFAEHLPPGWTNMVKHAGEQNDIILLQWLDGLGYVRWRTLDAATSAARLRNVEVLEWLFARYPDVMRDAVGVLREKASTWNRWYVYEWLGSV